MSAQQSDETHRDRRTWAGSRHRQELVGCASEMFEIQMTEITVVVCTYNRRGSLAKALESIANSAMPEPTAWEVLVVDNNSSDGTREAVEEFCSRYPNRFRYRFEPQQGKSYALNAALREAKGDVLAFTDDDVVVDSAWLVNLTTPLLGGKWFGSGGRTLPQGNFSLPRWFPVQNRHALGALALYDLGPHAQQMSEPPFGNNMAYRKQMFQKYGGFRTDLGPPPGNEVRGEDSEFACRLLSAGELLCYQPLAVVYHEVPPDRLTKRYFRRWFSAKGHQEFCELEISSQAKSLVHKFPLLLLARILVRTLLWMVTIKPSKRFSYVIEMAYLAGQIKEFWTRRRSRGNRKDKRPHRS